MSASAKFLIKFQLRAKRTQRLTAVSRQRPGNSERAKVFTRQKSSGEDLTDLFSQLFRPALCFREALDGVVDAIVEGNVTLPY